MWNINERVSAVQDPNLVITQFVLHTISRSALLLAILFTIALPMG